MALYTRFNKLTLAAVVMLLLGGVAWSQDNRQPIPETQVLEQKEKEFQEIFGKDLDKANSDQDRKVLADRLMKLANDSKSEVATYYLLLDKVRDLAVQLGDMGLISKSIEQLDKDFQVDGLKLKASAMFRADKLPMKPDARNELTLGMLDLITVADAAERFEIVEPLSDLLMSSARKSRNRELIERCTTETKRIRENKARVAEVEKARETLTKTPSNPEANTVVGMWLAMRGEWDEAMAYLALGSEELIAAPAKKELTRPGDANAQLALADAWWDAATSRSKSDEQDALKLRAAKWYREAESKLAGLSKVKAQKRIDELQIAQIQANVQAATHPVPGKNERPRRDPKAPSVIPGMIGRITFDKVDQGAILFYTPGKRLTALKVKDTFKLETSPRIEVQLAGLISVAKPAQLKVRHVGGSSSGGVLWAYVDGREIGVVGDDHYKDTTYDLTLQPGVHTIGWKLTGGNLGSCMLEFQDAESGEQIPVFYSPEMLAQQKQLGARMQADMSE